MAHKELRFCSIENKSDFEKTVAGLRAKTGSISVVQTHGDDFTSRILQIADKTMVKQETKSIQKWPGTALGGQAVCHRYRCTPAYFTEMDIYLKQQVSGRDLTRDLIKHILFHDDIQFYDVKGALLLFTVARNGTIAVREDFLQQ